MAAGGRAEDVDRLQAFRPVRLRSASDVVLAVLVDALRGGLYAPGELLPRERDLAERLGVSRPVLRQALAVLREAGVLSARRGPGGGTVVESLEQLSDVLAQIQGDTRRELRDVLEVRRATDPSAALLCAERASDEELDALERVAAELEGRTDDRRAFFEADLRFHVMIGELSRNRLLAAIVRDTLNHVSVLRDPYPYALVDYDEAIANQRTLMGALRSRERERILAAVDEHLAAFERVMLGVALPRI